MISADEIDKSIMELETKDTTFATCERLAWLYIVRDHLAKYAPAADARIMASGDSDFEKAINGKNPDHVWPIVADLVESIKIIHPKMYENFIQKIND